MALNVKIFDEEHEKDLEKQLNDFLSDLDEDDIVDIKYQLSSFFDHQEQIFCFSAMVIYKT